MRRVAAVLLGVLVVSSGCSLGPREQWVKVIRGGLETAEGVGTAKVWQSVAVEVIETVGREVPRPLIAKSEGVVDFDARRSRLVERADRGATVIYDDLLTFASRSEGAIGDDDEHWVRFDFGREPSVRIDDNDRRMAVGAALISPALAVELLEGVLTGSIDEIGSEEKAGASTTRYTARLAPDAAVTGISDERRRRGVLRVFESLGIQQDDFPVDVWIDEEDRVRGIRFVMRQQKDRVNAFELTSSWEFFEYGAPADIELPPSEDVVGSGRLRDFLDEITRRYDFD